MFEKDYIKINKDSWNNKVDTHMKSEFYNLDGFMQGESSLNKIELDLLGDLKGKSVLHLQCHFGQDSISLSRLGAEVTGVDLSDEAIKKAQQLAEDSNAKINFICCDIYDLPNHLDKQFDIVYTSYGVIGWLPDLDIWANLISKYLKPRGKLVFVEFHPVVWMFDDQFDKLNYRYFNSGPIREAEEGTYADKNANISQEFITWNHSLSEVVNNLLKYKLEINLLNEYDYSPYNCFDQTKEIEPKKYRITHLEDKIPMVYSIVATKK